MIFSNPKNILTTNFKIKTVTRLLLIILPNATNWISNYSYSLNLLFVNFALRSCYSNTSIFIQTGKWSLKKGGKKKKSSEFLLLKWSRSLARGSSYSDLTWKLFVLFKTGLSGDVVAYESWSHREVRLYIRGIEWSLRAFASICEHASTVFIFASTSS